MTLLEVMFAFK